MKKRLAVLLTLLVCMSPNFAHAYELPRIAVYVTGDVGVNEKNALGTRMLATLVSSGRYRGIERSGAFRAEIERELQTQRSGMIDDDQISALGRQFGVEYICIADITPVFGTFQVSARIINVETAEVVFIGDAHGAITTMDDLARLSNEVVVNMFGIVDEPEIVSFVEPAPPSFLRRYSLWVGIGLDVLGAGILTYGIIQNNNIPKNIDDRDINAARSSESNRNAAYIIGSVLLMGGITIHIAF